MLARPFLAAACGGCMLLGCPASLEPPQLLYSRRAAVRRPRATKAPVTRAFKAPIQPRSHLDGLADR